MHLEKIQAWLKMEEMPPEDMLAALYELNGTEAKAYFTLVRGPMSVQEVCNRLRKDRTIAQRALQRLVHKGLAHRVVEKKRGGGINYVYKPISLTELKINMDQMVDSWGALVKEKIKDI